MSCTENGTDVSAGGTHGRVGVTSEIAYNQIFWMMISSRKEGRVRKVQITLANTVGSIIWTLARHENLGVLVRLA